MSTRSVHLFSIRVHVQIDGRMLRALADEGCRRRVPPEALFEELLSEALAASRQRRQRRGRGALRLVPLTIGTEKEG